MFERFLPLWLCLGCVSAYLWPGRLPECQPYLPHLFAVTMFSVGWMLPRDELRQLVRRWPTVVVGTAVQYSVMPLLSYGLGRLFQVGDEMLIGMVLVGAVPGAMASNVVTLTARGNVSYSISLTTLATMLSPIVVPLWCLWALGATVEIDAWGQCWQLSWSVVLPVIGGFVCGVVLDRWRPVVSRIAPKMANLVILFLIAVVVAAGRDSFGKITVAVVTALVAVNVLGYLGGYGGARLLKLPPSMVRTLTIEVGMQNAGLGAVLARNFFADYPAALVPPVLYTFGCMLTGTLLAVWWSRHPPRDEMSGE